MKKKYPKVIGYLSTVDMDGMTVQKLIDVLQQFPSTAIIREAEDVGSQYDMNGDRLSYSSISFDIQEGK